jgi:hypothetical protein
MKTTILAAAVLGLVTVLPAVLAVLPLPLPTSVQDAQENQNAQENQCATENDGNDYPEGVIVDENGECQIIGNNLDVE